MNKAEMKEKYEIAKEQLESWREEIETKNALLLVQQDYGKGVTDYHRVFLFWHEMGQVQRTEITWALAIVTGYRLTDKSGRWWIAISGGGYDKTLEIKLALESALGVSGVRYGRI
jgi:hypothetical protein